MVRSILNFAKTIIYGIREPLFSLMPLRNRVVLNNFFGNGLGDDTKYIALALHRLYPELELVWIVSDENIELPDWIRPVILSSRFEYLYYLCTSKVWVLNVKNLKLPQKRQGQLYIQTWHATMALKKVEAEVVGTLTERYVAESMSDSKKIDLMYANNDIQYHKYRCSFWYDGKIIKCDVPRESILFHITCEIRHEIFKFFNLPDDAKIVLYAPTFRKSTTLDIYKWNYEHILDVIDKKFGGSHYLLLRLHPNVASKANDLVYSDRVINATAYPDMQELLGVTDILINDYSSSMFEFGPMLKKPVFLFAKDLCEYTKSDRALDFDFNELPFVMTETIEDLENEIKRFDRVLYNKSIEEFINKTGLEESGRGDEIIANIIYSFINTGTYGE